MRVLHRVWAAPAAAVAVVAAVLVTVGLPDGASPAPAATAAPAGLDAPLPAPARASRGRVVPAVAPLKALVEPDLLVTAPRGISAAQLVQLRRIKGVVAFSPLATGRVRIGGATVSALGVDPSSFRQFTPRETATSNDLWAAVARGDVAASYASRLPLGRKVSVVGRSVQRTRIGALASYGAVDADVLLEGRLGRQLGLRQTSLLLAAPTRSVSRLKAAVRDVLPGADLSVLRPEPVVYRRPATYRELYQLSARYCPGLDWKVLAAIGQVESGHGRNLGPSSAGALGPMQFMPATWAAYAVDGDGDGVANIMSAYDAVPAASLYLCRNGAGRGGQGLYNALFNYNHADWYVRKVLAIAAAYR